MSRRLVFIGLLLSFLDDKDYGDDADGDHRCGNEVIGLLFGLWRQCRYVGKGKACREQYQRKTDEQASCFVWVTSFFS